MVHVPITSEEMTYQIDQKNEVFPKASDHLGAAQEVSLQH